MLQVKDVDKKFAELDKLKASDWIRESPVKPRRAKVSTNNISWDC